MQEKKWDGGVGRWEERVAGRAVVEERGGTDKESPETSGAGGAKEGAQDEEAVVEEEGGAGPPRVSSPACCERSHNGSQEAPRHHDGSPSLRFEAQVPCHCCQGRVQDPQVVPCRARTASLNASSVLCKQAQARAQA